jgi:hypothetical protein
MLEKFRLSGDRNGGGTVRFNGRVLSPAASKRLINHSPDGFSWGYGGSGPAQLALAVLLEAGLPHGRALDLYQRFKWDHIATLPQGSFDVEIDLGKWIRGLHERA